MNRRDLLAALAAAPLLTIPAALEAQSIDAAPINAYLQQLRTAQGRFSQTNPDGSKQTGTFRLSKPGRIRFDYDSPKGALVVADGNWVGVFDPKSNRNPTRYPLQNTPLQMLLRDSISLAEPGLVLGATKDARGTHITVVDPRTPKDGRLVMTFSENPIQLREWEVISKTGQRTKVALTELRTGGSIDRNLFSIELVAASYR